MRLELIPIIVFWAVVLWSILGLAAQPSANDDPPQWELWLAEQNVEQHIIDSIRVVSILTGIDPVDLAAIGHVESNNHHYRSDGTVKRGDGGAAIGWGQVHRSPWQSYFRDELDKPHLDLDYPEHNIFIAAHILLYYDYPDDRMNAFAHYNGGPNPNPSYARRVDRAADQMR